MAARQCPECELRFATVAELREHLDTDHPGRITAPPVQHSRFSP